MTNEELIKDAFDNNVRQLMAQVKEQEGTMGYGQSINWTKVGELLNNSIDWDKAIELIQNVRDANKEKDQLGEVYIELRNDVLSISNTGGKFMCLKTKESSGITSFRSYPDMTS